MAEEQKKERREEAERHEITQSHEGFWVLCQIQGEAIQKLLITEKHDVNKLLKDHSASYIENGVKAGNKGGKLRQDFSIQARDTVVEDRVEVTKRERSSL